MEQPLRGLQVLVVRVVERIRCLDVERREGVVAAGARAALLERRRESGVDVGVVVDVRAEVNTAGLADGVSAGKGGEVPGVEALCGEGGDELGEGGGRVGEVAVGGALARGGRVAAAQWHGPFRSAKL